MNHRLLTACLTLMLGVFMFTGCAQRVDERQALYVACRDGMHILVYHIDRETGALDEAQRLEVPGRVGPIALTPDGKALYAALNNPARLLPTTRDTKSGTLTLLEPTDVPAFPTYLDIDATGKFALTASYGAGEVHTHAIRDDRTIRPAPLHVIKTERTAHACLIDPANRFVYIPHTTPNAVYQFRFNDTDGSLEPIQPFIVRGGGKPDAPAGPRHYVYHPTLDVVYFVNELDSSVSAYAWDRKGTGTLARFESQSTLPPGFREKNTCADIHITPDGRFLYASNRGHDSIAAYKLNKEGQMTLIDYFKTEARPREFAIDLNGQYLYAAGMNADKLAAYAIDKRTGRLNRIGTYQTPAVPIWVEAVELD